MAETVYQQSKKDPNVVFAFDPNGGVRHLTREEASAEIDAREAARGPGLGEVLVDAGVTGVVGAGVTALGAPLVAAGPPGVAANRALAGAAVGATQLGLDVGRDLLAGRGVDLAEARRNAAIAGTTEAVAPSAIRIGGQLLGPPARAGARALGRVFGRGFAPAAKRLAAESAEMIANAPTRSGAGEALQAAVGDAAEAAADSYRTSYRAFQRLGGDASVNVGDVVVSAEAALRDPSVAGSTARNIYEDFLSLTAKQARGEVERFDALGLDSYLSSLKRAQRAATDGNARRAYKSLVGQLERSLNRAFDPALAGGDPAARAALGQARKQFQDHVARFGRGSKLGKLLGGTAEDGSRLIENGTPAQIEELQQLLPEETFNAVRSRFFRDKVLKVPVDELGGGGVLGTGEATFGSVTRRFRGPNGAKLAEQFRAYYGDGAVAWLRKLGPARRAEFLTQPVFRRTGELVVLLGAGAGVGDLTGSAGAGVLAVASPLLAAQLMGSGAGRRILATLASRGTSPATQRIMLQALQREARKHGLEGHLRIGGEEYEE